MPLPLRRHQFWWWWWDGEGGGWWNLHRKQWRDLPKANQGGARLETAQCFQVPDLVPLEISPLKGSMGAWVSEHGCLKLGSNNMFNWILFIFPFQLASCPNISLLLWTLACGCSVMSDSLRPHEPQPTRLLCPWNFPGKNTGLGFHFLLQGIFLTLRSNLRLLCLLHWQAGSLPLAPSGSLLAANSKNQSFQRKK